LNKENITNIKIYNRTHSKNLIINNNNYEIYDLINLENDISPSSFIINCTPPGIVEKKNILSEKVLNNLKIFYDLNYYKYEFHSILKNEDIQIITGIDMLIYQAIKSIEIWFNIDVINKINIKDIKKYLTKINKC